MNRVRRGTINTESSAVASGRHRVNLSISSPAYSKLPKQELIDRIMRINRSARLEFLQLFTEADLAGYLERLDSVPPREEYTAWPMAC